VRNAARYAVAKKPVHTSRVVRKKRLRSGRRKSVTAWNKVGQRVERITELGGFLGDGVSYGEGQVSPAEIGGS